MRYWLQMQPALLWNLDRVDVLFLAGIFVIAVVLTLLTNPLTSWVNRMSGSGKTPKQKH